MTENYRIGIGTRIEIDKTSGTTGGDKVNSILAQYGFSPKDEKMDGDHVVEMQLGGPNDLDNLWPLKDGGRVSNSRPPDYEYCLSWRTARVYQIELAL